jgi:hypothetical protein
MFSGNFVTPGDADYCALRQSALATRWGTAPIHALGGRRARALATRFKKDSVQQELD